MSAKQKDVGLCPAHDQKIFCADFFRLCEIFSQIFQVPKIVTLHFFLFCKRMIVQKLPKAPLLHFLALCDLPETKKIRKKIRKQISKKSDFFQIFPDAGTVEENT